MYLVPTSSCVLFSLHQGAEGAEAPVSESDDSPEKSDCNKEEEEVEVLPTGAEGQTEETPAGTSNGPKLALKRCKVVEDFDTSNNHSDLVEDVTQSSGSSGEPQNDQASDTASLAESLPDIEAARRNQDHALATLGLYRYKIPGDGNCMFRAVASQLNLDQEKYHSLLRQVAVKWMRQHIEELLGAGLLDCEQDIDDMVMDGSWPNQAALVALSNVLSTNIAIIQGGDKGSIDIQHITPITPPPEDDQTAGVKLAYLYNGHYDSVVNEPNLSNPTYTMWAAQSMKENSNLSRSSENLLDTSEPYLPYARHNSPWHRKDKVPEGDPRRSLSHTPDPLDSDCSGMSDFEDNMRRLPAFEIDDVTIPDVCTFVCEMPKPSEEKLVHVSALKAEHPQENCVNLTPVHDGKTKEDSPEKDKEKRRSALFITLGTSQEPSSQEQVISKSRSLGDLSSTACSESYKMAENVKEEMILPYPVAENSSEIFVAAPPRTITSPPVLQAPVKAKIFPARKRKPGSPAPFTNLNITQPKYEPVNLGPVHHYSQSSSHKRPEKTQVFIPPPNLNNSGKPLSPTVRVLPIRLNNHAPDTSHDHQNDFDKVLLSPIQASIRAEGPVKITMPKEEFIHGVFDPSHIKVEKHDPPISHPPRVQQMNYVWTTPPSGDTFVREPPKGNGSRSRPGSGSIDHLWEKNMWSRMSPTGQSSYSEPIHVEIPSSTSSSGSHKPFVTTSGTQTKSCHIPVNNIHLTSGNFPSHNLDFSRSTQTNLKLSSPSFPLGFISTQSSDQMGAVFNLDKFLSPLRRDLDTDYIESLLKQQWFR